MTDKEMEIFKQRLEYVNGRLNQIEIYLSKAKDNLEDFDYEEICNNVSNITYYANLTLNNLMERMPSKYWNEIKRNSD